MGSRPPAKNQGEVEAVENTNSMSQFFNPTDETPSLTLNCSIESNKFN
jgi:hypothetical protein